MVQRYKFYKELKNFPPDLSGEPKGCCMNLFIGIVGSYAGAFISYLLDIELFGKGYLTNFVFCVIGAIAVLWIWKKLFD